MKTNTMSGYTFRNVFFILLLFRTSFSIFAQCPVVITTNPPPICEEGAGLSYGELTTLLVNNGSIVDNGATVRWYTNPTGGTPFVLNELVNQEGLFYIDNNDTGVDCSPRQEINIDFVVNPILFNLDKIFCSNEDRLIQDYIDEILTPNIPSGRTPEIYIDGALTTLANPSTQINGFTNLFVVIADDVSGCKSQVKLGRANVEQTPDNPAPDSPQDFCLDGNPTVGDLNSGTTTTPISWYTDVDSNGDPIGTSFVPLSALLVDGQTYYIQIDAVCPSEAMSVFVNVDDPVNPGTSNTLEYCNDNLPASDFDLFDELGTADTNGTWSGPLTTSNGNRGTVNISTLTTPGIYTFDYMVPSNGACPEASAEIIITVFETLSSGTVSTANPASFCEASLPSAFDLFTLLENQDPDGQWTQGTSSTDPIVASIIDLTGFTPNTYNFTYTQNLSPNPCPEDSTTVQIIVLTDPNAGIATNAIFCENELASNSPYDLFDALDDSQDNNSGTWTDSDDNTIPNMLDLTTLAVTGSPYTFNYTIDNGTCSDTEAITITVEPAPESGTPVATFPEFCEGAASASFELFNLLDGEDQTGTWYSGTDNTGTAIANPTDLSALTPGTYSFTFDVDAIDTCDDELVTVEITINPLPNTGTPASETFCENDLAANSPLGLFDQLTGEDPGGTWADDDASGALSGSDVNLTTLTIGTFNFTYTITDSNNCTNSSTVSIIVEEAPESGTANAPIEFCLAEISTDQTYNLFDSLTDEDQTGTWIDDDASGALSANLVTLDGLMPATYNFTYDVDAIGTCDDVNVTVSIIINDTPAPTATTPQAFCDTATVTDLVATGTTIKWYDAPTGGSLLTDTTALVDGQIYYATQADATTTCESSVRTAVTATIYQTPDAGGPNATAIISCNDNTSIDLFTGLDGTQDTGGIWNNDDGVGNLTDEFFDATGVSAGTYSFTYMITASAPCVDDSETIMITIEEPLNAGSATNAELDICSNNGTTDLFTLLGGADTGGVWSPVLTSTTGVFDPLVDVDGTYTYTLMNSCGTFTNQVEVTVTLAPNAGADNTLSICVADDPVDLFTLLGTGAQSGGVWSPELTSTTGVFDPAVDASATYIYTVTAVLPCSPDSTAEITVTVNDTPAIIVLDSDPEYCLADNPTVADLSISIRPTGTVNWYEDLALTTPVLLTDDLVDGKDYYATQTSNGCESSIAVQINVTVNDTPTPTLDDATLEYCVNDNPTIQTLSDNIIEYDSNLDNLRWYDSLTGGSGFSDDTLLTNTSYYVALVDQVTNCESSVRLEVIPDLTACGKLAIPDGFSPNGDRVNDTFDVDNLAILYPNFEMEIYNRNGHVVYKGNANSPRFDGTSNQGRIVSKGDLPVGVYFYIFNFNDGENKPEQGRLYLSR